jgi:predicted permease
MRLYRALLRFYPASFRAEYGQEMCALFTRRLRRASSAATVLALWLEALTDILPNAARAHADILRQDLRYAARSLARSPGFTLTAIVVASLGIGATTATFSILDQVLIRPLPFPESDRLVKLWQDESFRGYSRMEVSPGNFRDWKRLSKAFEAMAGYTNLSANLVGEGEPERLDGASVNGDLFDVLRAHAARGRIFTAADDRPGAPATVILSHGLWQTRFGGDPTVVGRRVLLNDAPYEIVGVMPANFSFPRRETRLWTTLRFEESAFQDRTDTWMYVIGRLRPGVSLERARAEMRVVAAQLGKAYPKENARISATVVWLRDEVSWQARFLLMALVGAAISVLLIACANLANLLLARALTRRRELAVRAALGAGRDRLVRQLLTESLVLAACGGALGVLLAAAAVPLVARLVPNALPIAETPPVDLRMLLIAAVLTAATGIGFGVVPALKACGDAGGDAIQEGSRGGVGRRTERLRSVLVVTEVMTSVALLICAGLLLRALWRLQGTDPGFRTDGVLTLRTALPIPKYNQSERRWRFYQSVLSEIRAVPGVAGAAYVSFLPMVMRGGIWPVAKAGEPEDNTTDTTASLRYVTPSFFATLGIPLRLGRDVADSDTRDSPYVAVVSESFARRFWPGENPLGRRFRFAMDDRTVVGVVGDVKVRGLERESEPQVYVPSRQVADASIIGYVPKDLVIRSSVAPAALLPTIREIIAKADPQLPVSDVQTLSAVVEADTAPRRVQARVVGAFAAIAFLLAGIGIHGLLAFTVSQRTREIGVRIALGAPSGEILKMVLRRGFRLAAGGVVLGAALAYAAGRAMEALLFGVSPADVATFAAAVSLSLAMATLGSLWPALRAVRIDPIAAIRAE